ncbi:MAG: BON domain-containing protein [Acidobacteriota bacterium]
MSKVIRILSPVALCAALALCVVAKAPTKTISKTAQKTPVAHLTKAKPVVKTDAEIQSCIEQKLAAAPRLKDQHLTVAVVNGVSTFTGVAKNAGSKGSVSGLAKSCGARSVVNHITVEAAMKTAAHPAANIHNSARITASQRRLMPKPRPEAGGSIVAVFLSLRELEDSSASRVLAVQFA